MHTRNVSVLSSSVHWAYSWYTVPWNDGLALNNLLFFPVWHGRHKKFHKWSVYFKTFKSQNLTHNLHCTGQLCCFDHVTPPLSLLAWELSIKKWWLSSHQFTTDLKIFYLWTYVHCEKFNFDVCISLTYQYFYYHYPGEFAWLTDMVLSAVLPQLHHNPSTLTPPTPKHSLRNLTCHRCFTCSCWDNNEHCVSTGTNKHSSVAALQCNSICQLTHTCQCVCLNVYATLSMCAPVCECISVYLCLFQCLLQHAGIGGLSV